MKMREEKEDNPSDDNDDYDNIKQQQQQSYVLIVDGKFFILQPRRGFSEITFVSELCMRRTLWLCIVSAVGNWLSKLGSLHYS